MRRDQKITQREAIFYHLYRNFKTRTKEQIEPLIPVWQMIGEIYCEEVKKWGFISYEVSARCSEMFSENPGLLERQYLKGRTGARYYGYRLAPDVKPEKILDKDLHRFYTQIRGPRKEAVVKSDHEK